MLLQSNCTFYRRDHSHSLCASRKMPRIKSEEQARKSRRYSTGSIANAPGGRRNRRGAPGNLPSTLEHPEAREEHRYRVVYDRFILQFDTYLGSTGMCNVQSYSLTHNY